MLGRDLPIAGVYVLFYFDFHINASLALRILPRNICRIEAPNQYTILSNTDKKRKQNFPHI